MFLAATKQDVQIFNGMSYGSKASSEIVNDDLKNRDTHPSEMDAAVQTCETAH